MVVFRVCKTPHQDVNQAKQNVVLRHMRWIEATGRGLYITSAVAPEAGRGEHIARGDPWGGKGRE